MDVSDLFASAPLRLWQPQPHPPPPPPPPPPSVAELAAAAGDAAATAAAAAAGVDAASLLDASPFGDDAFGADAAVAAAFSHFASSSIFPPVDDDDPAWPVGHDDDDGALPPALLPPQSLNVSHSALNSPSLSAAVPSSVPPPLCVFEAQSRSQSPPVNAPLSAPPPASVAPFADMHMSSQMHCAMDNYQPPPHQPRSVSPSSNNNRVTPTVSRSVCHTSSPPPAPAVTSRVNKTQKKKRQSTSSRATRTKSMPQLVVHPSRTQQPLRPRQPSPAPPPPSAPSQPHPPQQHIPHQVAAPLSKSPPPQLSALAQLTSSQTPTTAATPSTTNSIQRSPPRTPYSAAPAKPISLAPPQQQLNSAILPLPNNSSHPNLSVQLSSHTVLTNSASNQSKSQQNNGSTSTKHVASNSANKPAAIRGKRDKLARTRKLLRVRTKQQLIDQMLELVRASQITEDLLRNTLGPIDVRHYYSQCRSHYDLIHNLLPGGHTPGSPQYDGNTFQRCKSALQAFKNSIFEIGRMLVDASAWVEVLNFCLSAAQLNATLPQWPDPTHNKIKYQTHAKVEQFAIRAVNTMSRMKQAPRLDTREAASLMEAFRPLLPTVASKLGKLISVLHPAEISAPSEQQHGSERANADSSAV